MRTRRDSVARLLPALLLLSLLGVVPPAAAERVGEAEARLVARNWLARLAAGRNAADAAAALPAPDDRLFPTQLLKDDKGRPAAYVIPLRPQGYVVVPVLKEMAPVKAASDDADLDPGAEGGIAALLREELGANLSAYAELYGSLDAVQPAAGDVMYGRGQKRAWTHYLRAPADFDRDLAATKDLGVQEVGPLLRSNWHQRQPFNDFCPAGYQQQRCLLGCVATAVAQIMQYHRWPQGPLPRVFYRYTWEGDRSCDSSRWGGGAILMVYGDPIDWANIPDRTGQMTTPEQREAVAMLCYMVATSVNMQFGVCNSGAGTGRLNTIFGDLFGYERGVRGVRRTACTPAEWFTIIQDEVNESRPMFYALATHAVVCDGWRVAEGVNQYHMNYGWSDGHTTWYTVDELYHSPLLESELVYFKIVPLRSGTSAAVAAAPAAVLEAPSPNPFNPTTGIAFELTEAGPVQLAVYGVDGALVRELVAESRAAGRYREVWDGRDRRGAAAPSGVYFFRLKAGAQVRTQRAVLVK